MKIVEIARVAHEINRAYCAAIGETSHVPWEEAPDWQAESLIHGVATHLVARRTPQESHASWLERKAAEGWVYGPIKDPVAKTHPCIVPFEDLSTEDRMKDVLFVAVVEALR